MSVVKKNTFLEVKCFHAMVTFTIGEPKLVLNASWLKMIQWKRWRRKQFFYLFSTLKRLMRCTRVNQENGIEIKWKAADSSSNEKRQAKALFQESEINAFLYYADHEYEHFKDAATYDKG